MIQKKGLGMILVHLNQSVPEMLADRASGVIDDDGMLDRLREKTRKEWARVSKDAITMYGDYIGGVYKGEIVSMYKIVAHEIAPANPREGRSSDRVAFDVVPAPEMRWVIGRGAPGGPWRQGESRPVRYAFTGEFFDFYITERGVPREETEPKTGSEAPGAEDMDSRVLEAFSLIEAAERKPTKDGADSPRSGASLLEQVEVTLNPRGGIIVTVPATTRVQIVPRSD